MPCIFPENRHYASPSHEARRNLRGFSQSALLLERALNATISSGSHATYRSQLHARGLGDAQLIKPDRFTQAEKLTIQIVSACSSSVSVLSTLMCLYWLVKMRKYFRHRLIALMILGDFLKGFSYLVFIAIVFTHGPINSSQAICQGTGFLIQFGTVAADAGILFVSLHTALQVFRRTSTASTSRGLASYRYYVYASYFILPLLSASLAFLNPGNAYQSAGAFCSLPFRPYWYRLALSWVPRYIIAMSIIGLATAIYIHVGLEFKNLAAISDNYSTSLATLPLNQQREASEAVKFWGMGDSSTQLKAANKDNAKQSAAPPENSQSRGEKLFDAVTADASQRTARKESVVTIMTDGSHPGTADTGSSSTERLKDSDASKRHSQSKFWNGSAQTPAPDNRASQLPGSPRKDGDSRAGHLSGTQKAIQRQLRLMFIYPLVYILMWIVPFAAHCMNYNDYRAAHPVHGLSIFVAFNLTIMGTVDCVIFSLRERPWRHIPGSDGTIIGSFRFWRHGRTRTLPRPPSPPAQGTVPANGEKQHSTGPLVSPLSSEHGNTLSSGSPKRTPPAAVKGGSLPARPPIHTRNSSDRRQADADHAYTRLAWEREIARLRLESSKFDHAERGGMATKVRQWWDRRESELAKFKVDEEPSADVMAEIGEDEQGLAALRNE